MPASPSAAANGQRSGPLTQSSAVPQTASQTQAQQSSSSQTQETPAATTVNGAATNGENGPPTSSAAGGLVYPALHLLPLNNTFVPKQISLSPPGTRIKIGRQTNAKTVPSATNGYFDSKVLSRMHAEVWSDDGKVFIKDVKSSNGTFINGDRLSPEGAESDAFELHSEDIVEFGIDIVSDDNKTIVHHKVSTKIHIAVSAEEAMTLMKNLPALYRMHDTALHRRPSKAGLTFDHVFNRLQTELHKSRETGGELGGLTNIMADIHETLGGGVPPPLPQFPQPARASHYGQILAKGAVDPQTLALLQAQLTDTQASLAGHADRVRALEGLLAEHENIKTEVGSLKSQLESTKREMDAFRSDASSSVVNGSHVAGQESEEVDIDDASSEASVETVRDSASGRRRSNSAALREQNAALVLRIEVLSEDLQEATLRSQSLTVQQQSAQQSVESLETRLIHLEHEAIRRKSEYDIWRQEVEADWRRDRDEWTAERQSLQAIIRRLGVADSAFASATTDVSSGEADMRLFPPSSLDSGQRGTDRQPPHALEEERSSLSAAVGSRDKRLLQEESASGSDSDATIDPLDRGVQTEEARIESSCRSNNLHPAGRPGRVADPRWLAGASLPIAGTVGLLAIGVAVWVMAQRSD